MVKSGSSLCWLTKQKRRNCAGPLLTVSSMLQKIQSGDLDMSVDVCDLLNSKALLYIDAAEVYTLNIALGPENIQSGTFDLMEIHPHLMLGVTAALIPLLQANQSPRSHIMSCVTVRLC